MSFLKIQTLSLVIVTAVGCTSASSLFVSTSDTKLSQNEFEPSVELAADNTEHNPSSCLTTQRDLTVPWASRRYWCRAEIQRDHSGSIDPDWSHGTQHAKLDTSSTTWFGPDAHALTPQTSKASDSAGVGQVLKTHIEIRSADEAMSRSPDIEVAEVVEVAAEENEPRVSVKERLQTQIPRNTSIPFAKSRRVLDPSGRLKTEAFIQVAAEAESIDLQGFFTEDEIKIDSANYREILSVARALAVMQYWRKHGVDTSKVKILHHDPEVKARAVQVNING